MHSLPPRWWQKGPQERKMSPVAIQDFFKYKQFFALSQAWFRGVAQLYKCYKSSNILENV